MTKDKAWQTVSSKYLVNDRWLKLRAESCVTPEGKRIEPYYVMEYPDWANCLVVDQELNVLLVRQYRHGTKDHVLECVAGWIDPEDKNPEQAIQRELAEEIGYTGGRVFLTGVNYTNPAYLNNRNYSFLAVGGSCNAVTALGEGESTLVIEQYPLKEFCPMAGRSGRGQEVMQSFHLANVLLAQQFIRESDDPIIVPLKATLPK